MRHATGRRRGAGLLSGPLRPEIDAVNHEVFQHVNNGVYKAGFARSQEAHDEAVRALFDTLDALEARLSRQRYLAGDQITEADWRLFTTLVRFDPVYVGHFKCNLKRLVDYPSCGRTTRALPASPHRRDRRLLPHQAPLLRQPREGEPDRNRADGPDHRLERAPRARLSRLRSACRLLRLLGRQQAVVQVGERDRDLERLQTDDAIALEVLDLPAVRLAPPVLDPGLGAGDQQDILHRRNTSIVRQLVQIIGRGGRRRQNLHDRTWRTNEW